MLDDSPAEMAPADLREALKAVGDPQQSVSAALRAVQGDDSLPRAPREISFVVQCSAHGALPALPNEIQAAQFAQVHLDAKH